MGNTNHYPSLQGKTVLITGGASGIGAAMVEAFYAQGAKVAFIDIKDEQASKLICGIKENDNARPAHVFSSKSPADLVYHRCDLANISELQSTIQSIRSTLGPISVLINNAANDARHELNSVDESQWQNTVDLNLKHAFFACQTVVDNMKILGGGSIINLGSVSWRTAKGGMPIYLACKAALEGLTRGLARDLGPANIRVNTLVPGWVITERQQMHFESETALSHLLDKQCLSHKLLPEHICAMALFLASDDSQMCTGQHYVVDGGLS